MNLLNKVIIITSGDNGFQKFQKFREITMNLLNKSLSSLVVIMDLPNKVITITSGDNGR